MKVVRFRIAQERFALLVDEFGLSALGRLTRAEGEIASLVRAGWSNARIARARGTSVHTVANQVASLMQKLGVGSRAELALVSSGAERGTGAS